MHPAGQLSTSASIVTEGDLTQLGIGVSSDTDPIGQRGGGATDSGPPGFKFLSFQNFRDGTVNGIIGVSMSKVLEKVRAEGLACRLVGRDAEREVLRFIESQPSLMQCLPRWHLLFLSTDESQTTVPMLSFALRKADSVETIGPYEIRRGKIDVSSENFVRGFQIVLRPQAESASKMEARA